MTLINRTGTVGETVSGALTPYLIDNTSLIVMNDHLESKLFFNSFRILLLYKVYLSYLMFHGLSNYELYVIL